VTPISLERPFLQLRQQIGNLSDEPGIAEVHRLRARSQSVCSLLAALKPANPQPALRLRDAIQVVSKAAGRVRDLDVTSRIALTLRSKRFAAPIDELERKIGKRRQRAATKLADIVQHQRRSLQRALKKYRKTITGLPAVPAKAFSVDLADCLHRSIVSCLGELARWPEPDETNLHSFRLQVKHLRTLLRLQADADPRLLASLERARTCIGAWHDWTNLAQAARKRLPAPDNQALVARIDHAIGRKLAVALKAAQSLRTLIARRNSPSSGGAVQDAKRSIDPAL
jgi:CHAD domain-containing protein